MPNKTDAANVALTIVGQINPLIEQAVRAFAAFVAARKAAIAANPTLPDGTIKTPAEVFEQMMTSGGLLESEVAEARARIAELPPMKPTGLGGADEPTT